MVRLAYRVGLLIAVSTGAGVTYQEKTSDNSSWWSSLRVVRFGRAAYTVLGVAIDYKWTLSKLSKDTSVYYTTRSKVHLRSAQKLREMCRKNGGYFIKMGQHIGALEYLLPSEYVETFKVFHSDAPQTSIAKLKKVIEEELHCPVEDIFSELDDKPLGAASLAQCHRGVLKDGRVVAVKIQHPHVKKNAYTDMSTVDFLVSCITRLFPDFQFQWLADEIRRNLPKELDFIHEAKNMKMCSNMLHHLNFIKIPRVYTATSRLLIMEFCEGGKINNLRYIKKHCIPVNEVSLKLAEMYSEMIYKYGFIHCDPHPGNILVRKTDIGHVELVLLDHGLYQQLTQEFRLLYCRLWKGLISRDMEAIKTYCTALNAGELYPLLACIITGRTWHSIEHGISTIARSSQENVLIRVDAINYFPEISQLLNSAPRQLLLILKTNDLLRSLEYTLQSNCHTHSYITMSKYCIQAIGEEEEKCAESYYKRIILRMQTKFSILTLYLYGWWVWLIPSLA